MISWYKKAERNCCHSAGIGLQVPNCHLSIVTCQLRNHQLCQALRAMMVVSSLISTSRASPSSPFSVAILLFRDSAMNCSVAILTTVFSGLIYVFFIILYIIYLSTPFTLNCLPAFTTITLPPMRYLPSFRPCFSSSVFSSLMAVSLSVPITRRAGVTEESLVSM